jgi:hypothetical protein
MGAETFTTYSVGKNSAEAFAEAVRRASYDYGHNGYTGTVAEKDSFTPIDLPAEWAHAPKEFANKLIGEDDSRVDDKWGPAGCLEISFDEDTGVRTYLFFGWASC